MQGRFEMPTITGAPQPGDSDDALKTDGEGVCSASSRLHQLPNLPMVRHNHRWYRCRTLRTTNKTVQLEFQGFESETTPFTLSLVSNRLWRGSYKGRDWRHLVPSPLDISLLNVTFGHMQPENPVDITCRISPVYNVRCHCLSWACMRTCARAE
jgi:hypothetical protein